MPDPSRLPSDDPREWLNRARSDLALARRRSQDVYLEDLCFHAQQAAEKAIKAILIHQQVEFPYIHDIGQLLREVARTGITVTEDLREVETLTRFAVISRYPGLGEPPRVRDHEKAVQLARDVVAWADAIVMRSGEAI